MPPIVKICGITNPEDARAAIDAGADALGFVFWEKSPRSILPEMAARIFSLLSPMIVKVGVFVDPEPDLVLGAIAAGVNILQFHGKETPDFCSQFGVMAMKAFRVRDDSFLAELERYRTEAFLLDAYTAEAPGGTGERFNWDLALAAKSCGKPLFLAGGLTPENVADAVQKVQPYGVDVSSGVESKPGIKDHFKLRAFIQAAKQG